MATLPDRPYAQFNFLVDLDARGNDVAMEELVFTYERLEIE
jgi:hypothetical protein